LVSIHTFLTDREREVTGNNQEYEKPKWKKVPEEDNLRLLDGLITQTEQFEQERQRAKVRRIRDWRSIKPRNACLSTNGLPLIFPCAMNDQWFVHSDGEQMGPYSGEQLVQYVQEGRIIAETLVWAEGMPEWLPASQIEGLIPVAPAARPAPAWAPPGARTPATSAARARTSPYAPPASSLTAQAVGGQYPYIPVKPAGFGLWLLTFLGGLLCFLIGFISMTAGVASSAQAASAAGSQEIDVARATGMGAVFVVIGWIFLMVSAVFFYINLYRAWSCLQAGAPRTTPGKAVGFLFIPLFNLYWIFMAIAGLASDWNRIVASYEDLKAAPKLNDTMFVLFCIGSLIFPPLSLILIFPVMSQICKGINFFAFRRNPNAPGMFGGPGLR
jgi:hypothetical protein